MATRTKTRAVTKKADQLPASYGDDAGIGADDVTGADLLIPFVRILQPLSPQLQKKDESFVKGAEAGMLFNSSTSTLYDGDEGIEVLLAYKGHGYAEFVPRDEGGGFVAQREADDPEVIRMRQEQGRFGKLATPGGTELIETYYGYAINLSDETPGAIVLPFASSAITPFKQFLAALKPLLNRGIPIFAPRIRVTTRTKTNKKGTFFVPHLELAGETMADYHTPPDAPELAMARELRESVVAGRARADTAGLDSDDVDDAAF